MASMTKVVDKFNQLLIQMEELKQDVCEIREEVSKLRLQLIDLCFDSFVNINGK